MKFYIRIILVIAILFFAVDFFAQPGGAPPGGPGSGTPPCWPPPCIPVDGGISFLIALGAAYGGKKAFDKFKNQD